MKSIHTLFLAYALIFVGKPALAEDSFKDCSDCPEMIIVPGGRFLMGGISDPISNFTPEPNEIPQHEVSVNAFSLGKFEVTQSLWLKIMNDNPSDYIDGNGYLPVETVSWHDAKEFTRRLSIKTGKNYRLPTEAEWEYAARAGSASRFPFGNKIEELDIYGWYSANSGGHIHVVGLKAPNNFGIYDMQGNVWEWIEDCYLANYTLTPVDGTSPPDKLGCLRNNRGGSWINSAINLRPDHRHKMGAGSRGTFVGFRVARSLD